MRGVTYLHVAGDLGVGSGGGEGTRKADDDDTLVGRVGGKVDLLGREARVELRGGQLGRCMRNDVLETLCCAST